MKVVPYIMYIESWGVEINQLLASPCFSVLYWYCLYSMFDVYV